MKKLLLYLTLFFITFIVVSLLALPILFDLIFSIFIIFIFRKNFPSIIIFNFLIVSVIFIISVSFGKNEKHEFFYRAHEKYKTKKAKYQKNISDTIFMPYGDIYALDVSFDGKKDLIKEPRKQEFITDDHGIRNNITKIEDADIILVGDSFITGNGTTQKHIPANILSKISGKKVASLTYGGLNPAEYQMIIHKYLDIIKKNAKIFVFYFEGNDFFEINKNKKLATNKTIISFYKKLEINKDKFLLLILSEKNYFLRNIRAKSHLLNQKIFSIIGEEENPIKYFEIGNKTVGFYYTDDLDINSKFVTYIFQHKKILERVNGFFFIPTKLRVYSDYIDSVKYNGNNKFKYLKDGYSYLNKPVYDLTEIMKLSISKYLSKGKYLYWRDDTHWNQHGIFEAMSYINNIMKK